MPPFTAESSAVARVEPSPNFDDRAPGAHADMIVLHYTGMPTAEEAIARLCDPKARVSAHYVVLENGSILQLVPESKRAWHAGVASWGHDTDINSRSIGIEIVNPGHDFGYPDFPLRQVAATIVLCRTILLRRTVRPENIVAHSDIAPSRKQDPGEKFPWERLAQSKIGLWVRPAPIVDGPAIRLNDLGARVTDLQNALADYGYGIAANGLYDEATRDVVAAFQRHFRPARVDGVADVSTLETLRKLLAARGKVPAPKAPASAS